MAKGLSRRAPYKKARSMEHFGWIWDFSAFAIRSAIKAPLPSRRFLSHFENVFSRGLGCVSAFSVLPQLSRLLGRQAV